MSNKNHMKRTRTDLSREELKNNHNLQKKSDIIDAENIKEIDVRSNTDNHDEKRRTMPRQITSSENKHQDRKTDKTCELNLSYYNDMADDMDSKENKQRKAIRKTGLDENIESLENDISDNKANFNNNNINNNSSNNNNDNENSDDDDDNTEINGNSQNYKSPNGEEDEEDDYDDDDEESSIGLDDHLLASEENFVSDKVITLNIGGSIVSTLESTLKLMPSNFSVWIEENFESFPRDAHNYPYLDRDIETFKLILNYLRGYGLPSKVNDLVLLAEDAMYYNLTNLQNEIGLCKSASWHFNAGPGVNRDGNIFSMQDILGVCGTEPLSVYQTHTIVFKVDKCELVTLGVIALGDVYENMQLQRQRNSISFCSTGELIRYLTDEPLFTSGTSYKAQDLITISVKFDKEKILEHKVPGEKLASSTNVLSKEETNELEYIMKSSRSEEFSNKAIENERLQETSGQASVHAVERSHLRNHDIATKTCVQDVTLKSKEAVKCYNGNEIVTSNQDLPEEEEQIGVSVTNKSVETEESSSTSNNWGATITFKKEEKTEFVVNWPAPVPPIQFAASMQGASSVTIVDVISVDRTSDNKIDVVDNQGNVQSANIINFDPSSMLSRSDSLPILQQFSFIFQGRY